MFRGVFADLRQQDGIVGAAEDECVNLGVYGQDPVNIFLHEVVGSIAVKFTGFNKGHPHRAFEFGYLHPGVDLLNLHAVGVAADCAGSGKKSDVSVSRDFTEDLHCRTNHTEYAAVGVGDGEEMLLDGAQGFCRGSVAGEDHQLTPPVEQVVDGLAGEFVDDVEAAGAVWGARVVAEEEVIVLWEALADFAEDGEAAIAGIKDSDRAGSGWV